MIGITSSQAAYLGELLRLGGETQVVSSGAWAEALSVSPAAASRMARRLERSGLIERIAYKGVRLTARGRSEGARAVRAHRMAEAFLVRVLGYGWHEAHDTADRLGEIADETLVSRMEERAGHPRRCPHGEPIPGADGTIETLTDRPLSQASVGASGRISRVRVREADRLIYLAETGAVPEARFSVEGRAPFSGPVRTPAGGGRGGLQRRAGSSDLGRPGRRLTRPTSLGDRRPDVLDLATPPR